MIKIVYPSCPFKTKNENDRKLIFDPLRKQWLLLTPEEWVRQNFLQYLLQTKKCPASLVAVEKEIKLGELTKRCDIIVYGNQANPLMIVECKAMDVELNNKTLDQILRYNISVPVPHLIITNGSYCFGFKRQDNDMILINEIPDWPFG